MPVAVPFIMAAAAIAGAVVQGVSVSNQAEAQEKALEQQKETDTQNFRLSRAGQFQQGLAQRQAMAGGYTAHLLKLNTTKREMSDMRAFTKHHAPQRRVSTRHTTTERENNVRSAFNDALPSRGYGKPTFRAS